MAAKFEIYKDKAGEFRWRLVHTNGQAIASSGDGYKTKASATNGINSVKENAPGQLSKISRFSGISEHDKC